MQVNDIAVLQHALQLLDGNNSFWLCTITHTYGSAPRPVGSLFISDGELRVGSISGGCLEDAFVDMIKANHFQPQNQKFLYGEHGQQHARYSELPCGGRIELLLEFIEPNDANRLHFHQWLALATKQQAYQRQISWHEQLRHIHLMPSPLSPQSLVEQDDNDVRINYHCTVQLLLIGIGAVSEQIARLAILNGFKVKVCDMRHELNSSWGFHGTQGGVDISWQSPDEFVSENATSDSAVLALAHDPRLDDVALMTVFDSDAFYIGAMGSTRTSETRRQRLKRICEISDRQLQRLHAPIGLNIGSKTPFEIAIACIADILRVRNGIEKSQL